MGIGRTAVGGVEIGLTVGVGVGEGGVVGVTAAAGVGGVGGAAGGGIGIGVAVQAGAGVGVVVTGATGAPVGPPKLGHENDYSRTAKQLRGHDGDGDGTMLSTIAFSSYSFF